MAEVITVLDGVNPATEPVAHHTRKNRRHSGSRIGKPIIVTMPTIDTRHLAWQDESLCSATDPEGFFPDGPPTSHVLNLCRACPVRSPCLRFALDDPTLGGIWAATTALERKSIRLSERRHAERAS